MDHSPLDLHSLETQLLASRVVAEDTDHVEAFLATEAAA